jgi:hypothetical protein
MQLSVNICPKADFSLILGAVKPHFHDLNNQPRNQAATGRSVAAFMPFVMNGTKHQWHNFFYPLFLLFCGHRLLWLARQVCNMQHHLPFWQFGFRLLR